MAIWTTADRDAVKAAIAVAYTAGVAEVQIGSERVRAMTLADLLKLLEQIQADLATDQPHFGMRLTRLVPPGCG